MANYVLVDKEQLEVDLTIVADSIRAKANVTARLEFPNGMKQAVENMQSGEDLTEELSEQDKLIDNIKNLLVEKSVGIVPKGSIEIAENGTYDVTEYASAVVDVPSKDVATCELEVDCEGYGYFDWEIRYTTCDTEGVRFCEETYPTGGDSKKFTLVKNSIFVIKAGEDMQRYESNGVVDIKESLRLYEDVFAIGYISEDTAQISFTIYDNLGGNEGDEE